MKFLSFLIAILVLTLNGMPCSDAGMPEHGNNGTTNARSSAAAQHSSDEEHEDLCSPFCQCACCSLAYALPLTLPPGTILKTDWNEQQFASFQQHCPAGIALPVWQPPQLV